MKQIAITLKSTNYNLKGAMSDGRCRKSKKKKRILSIYRPCKFVIGPYKTLYLNLKRLSRECEKENPNRLQATRI